MCCIKPNILRLFFLHFVKNGSGNAYGLNFDYGPCRGTDTKNCYGLKVKGSNKGVPYGDFVFYKSGPTDYDIIDGSGHVSQIDINEFFSDYPEDYNWDDEKEWRKH